MFTFNTPVTASVSEQAANLRSTSGSLFVGSNGELNASSKKDLLQQQQAFLVAASADGLTSASDAAAKADMRKQAVIAAFADKNEHKELGEVMADTLKQAADRSGWMRNLLAKQPLLQGQLPRVRMELKNVVATVATGPTQIQAQLVRDSHFTPPEFSVHARPFITELDIAQSVGDILNSKFVEATTAFMVAEDRLWRSMAMATKNVANQVTNVVGNLTPGALMTIRNQVDRWNLPVSTMILASDLWSDIADAASFQAAIDPVSKYELLLTGRMGVLYGMSIITDGTRHPEHKVLNRGEIFVVSDPQNHGQYTDRNGITSQPIDASTEHVAGRGWVMSQLLSMVIANPRSVAMAIRT